MFYLPYGLLVYALIGAVVSIVAIRVCSLLGHVQRPWSRAGDALVSSPPPHTNLAYRGGSLAEPQGYRGA
jgi:hypothetical protein